MQKKIKWSLCNLRSILWHLYSFKYLIIIKITISHSKVKTLTRIEETQLTYSLHDFLLFSASKQKLSSAKENQKRERESDLPSGVSEWNSNAIWDLSVWFVHGDPRRRWWLGVREASDLRYDSNLTGRVKCLCAVGSARWSRSHGTQRKSLNLSQSLRAESQKRKWNSKFQRERERECVLRLRKRGNLIFWICFNDFFYLFVFKK